jgi:hypothetical protein
MAKVIFPASDLLAGLGSIATLVERRRAELLEILGVRFLSEAQQDFQRKSRGGKGNDGIKWKPLADATIERKGRRGVRNEKRKETAGGKPRPQAGSSQIGVDTGLMRASAQPGFSGSATTRSGQKRTATNVFAVSERSVTVGYAREYAEYFDEVRPLLPEKLPRYYQDALDDSAQRFLDKYVKGEFA